MVMLRLLFASAVSRQIPEASNFSRLGFRKNLDEMSIIHTITPFPGSQ
jgi:hypothetical protein